MKGTPRSPIKRKPALAGDPDSARDGMARHLHFAGVTMMRKVRFKFQVSSFKRPVKAPAIRAKMTHGLRLRFIDSHS